MAEGGVSESALSSADVGSDGIFTHLCDPCKFDKTETEGISYCRVCAEFLCKVCLTVHQKSKATRGHKIVQGADFNRIQRSSSTFDFEFCSQHVGQVVQFYCQNHADLLCKTCKSVKHRNCETVRNITSICRGIKESQTTEKHCKAVVSLIKKLEDLKQERSEDLTSLEQQRDICLKERADLLDAVNKLFDDLEKEMNQKLYETVNMESKDIVNHISSLDSGIQQLTAGQANLTEARTHGGDQQVFVAMERIDIGAVATMLDDIQKEKRTVRLSFQAQTKLQKLLPALQDLGQLTAMATGKQKTSAAPSSQGTINLIVPGATQPNAGKTDTCTSSHIVSAELKDMKFQKIGQCEVKEAKTRSDPKVKGCVFLPRGECVLLCEDGDYALKGSVRLLDSMLRLKASIKLPGAAWDIALVSPTSVVVTLPDSGFLQYITVYPALKLGCTLELGKRCYGVAVCDDNAFVTAQSPLKKQRRGKRVPVVMKVSTKTEEAQILCKNQFACPSYIAVDARRTFMYVSDRDEHKVICFNMDGGIVYQYTDQALNSPNKLYVDDQNYVIVCSNALQVISPDGDKYRTLVAAQTLDPRNLFTVNYDFGWGLSDITENHRAFCYRPKDGTLILVHGDSQVLRYKLTKLR